MNRSCEWEKFFDETVGRYRYRHKGTGLIRDTLAAIGRAFAGPAKNVATTAAEKAAKAVAEKVGQKVGEIAAEKGSKKIQEILRKRQQGKGQPREAKRKLEMILRGQIPKTRALSTADRLKLKRILANQI